MEHMQAEGISLTQTYCEPKGMLQCCYFLYDMLIANQQKGFGVGNGVSEWKGWIWLDFYTKYM